MSLMKCQINESIRINGDNVRHLWANFTIHTANTIRLAFERMQKELSTDFTNFGIWMQLIVGLSALATRSLSLELSLFVLYLTSLYFPHSNDSLQNHSNQIDITCYELILLDVLDQALESFFL